MADLFRTIEAPSQGLYKEKGSKFIAFAFSINSEDAIKEKTASIRKQYHDARHHCFAWRLGAGMERYRVNDDGEPSGSAGKPIFGQIQSRNLTDILIVVIRYFGGTLLGVGGLINAYRSATADALNQANIIELKVFTSMKLKFSYPQMNGVMKVIKDFHLQFEDPEFDLECTLTLKVWQRDQDQVAERMLKIEGCEILTEGNS